MSSDKCGNEKEIDSEIVEKKSQSNDNVQDRVDQLKKDKTLANQKNDRKSLDFNGVVISPVDRCVAESENEMEEDQINNQISHFSKFENETNELIDSDVSQKLNEVPEIPKKTEVVVEVEVEAEAEVEAEVEAEAEAEVEAEAEAEAEAEVQKEIEVEAVEQYGTFNDERNVNDDINRDITGKESHIAFGENSVNKSEKNKSESNEDKSEMHEEAEDESRMKLDPKKELDTKLSNEMADDEEIGVFSDAKGLSITEEDTSFVNEVDQSKATTVVTKKDDKVIENDEDGFGDFESETKKDKTNNQISQFSKSKNESNELVHCNVPQKLNEVPETEVEAEVEAEVVEQFGTFNGESYVNEDVNEDITDKKSHITFDENSVNENEKSKLEFSEEKDVMDEGCDDDSRCLDDKSQSRLKLDLKKELDTKSSNEMFDDEEFGVFSDVKGLSISEEDTSFVNEVDPSKATAAVMKDDDDEDGFGDFESEMKDDKTNNQTSYVGKSENETNELVHFNVPQKLNEVPETEVEAEVVEQFGTFNDERNVNEDVNKDITDKKPHITLDKNSVNISEKSKSEFCEEKDVIDGGGCLDDLDLKQELDTKLSNEMADDEEFGVFSDVKGSCISEEDTSFVNEVQSKATTVVTKDDDDDDEDGFGDFESEMKEDKTNNQITSEENTSFVNRVNQSKSTTTVVKEDVNMMDDDEDGFGDFNDVVSKKFKESIACLPTIVSSTVLGEHLTIKASKVFNEILTHFIPEKFNLKDSKLLEDRSGITPFSPGSVC